MTRSQPVFEELEPNPDIAFKNADVCISQVAALEMSHLQRGSQRATHGCYLFLVQYRNPGPQGQVRVQWLCHLNDPFVTHKAELSPQP